jgi:hypothetical protein
LNARVDLDVEPVANWGSDNRARGLGKLVRYCKEHRRPRKFFGIGLMHLIYTVKRLWIRDELIVSPEEPREAYSLWKLCRLAGIKTISEKHAHNRPYRHRIGCIRHDDSTWDDAARDCLNGRCTDISKSHVDAVFGQVFGYDTKIDPVLFEGRAVMKPELNYSGGGIFVTCPLGPHAVRNDCIYQRLVDNETADGVVTEYRLSVICGEITDVIVQRRSVANRLTGRGRGGGQGSTICSATDVFSDEEIAQLLEFCALMNLDFGELDVLPDVAEKRIYVLDANKTPSYMVTASSFRPDRFFLIYRRARRFRHLLRRNATVAGIAIATGQSEGAGH